MHPDEPLHERRRGASALRAALAVCWLLLVASPLRAQVTATHLYTLSNFGGKLPYDWARISVDQDRDEIYVIASNLVRIFNASGMETFSFGDDLGLGQIVDAAVDQNGDIVLLSYNNAQPTITRCNYRGVPIGVIEIKNLPAGMPFAPNRIIYRNGLFYFPAMSTGLLIMTDANGEYRDSVNLIELVSEDEKKPEGAELFGLSVDGQGNVFFTVAVFFKAYRMAPDRSVASFGSPGSAAGRFGIAAGIVTDSHGHVLVVDRLRCVVMVFDKNFKFLTEFGRRGFKPQNLIVPDDIGIDKRDRIYVTQRRKRGVSVFALATAE